MCKILNKNMIPTIDAFDLTLQKMEGITPKEYEEVVTEKSISITVSDVAKPKGKLIPFGRTTQQHLSGKNLFDKNATLIAISYCSVTFENGIYTITSAASGNPAISLSLDLPAGDYTLNSEVALSNATQIRNSSDTTIANLQANYSNKQFTLTEDATAIRFNWPNSSEPIVLDLNTLQIEQGSTVTSYEPYCGGQPSPNPDYPQEIENVEGNILIKVANGEDETQEGYQERSILFPLSEGQKLMEGDYLAEDGIHHVREKIVLDGSQLISSFISNTALSTQNYKCFFYSNSNIIKIAPNDTTICVIADKLIGTSSNQRTSDMPNCWINHLSNGQLGMHVPNTVTNTTELKEWLTNNPIEFEVIRKGEKIDQYTQEQQEAYNNLKNCKLFKGTNYIFTIMETLKPNLQLTYYKEKEE